MLDVLKQKIGHTTCYVHLLSILQHLILLPGNSSYLFHIRSVSIFWHIVRRAFHESNMNPFPRVSLFFSDVQYSAAIAARENVEMKGGWHDTF